MKLTLRTKLIGSFLVVIVTCSAITTIIGVHMMEKAITDEVRNEVRHNLNSAREIYQEVVSNVRSTTRYTAARFFMKDALLTGDMGKVAAELSKVRQREGLDVLTLTDSSGTVVLRSRNPAVRGDSQASNEIIKRVLSSKDVVASTEIVPREELLKEGENLAARAWTPLVKTPRAKPTHKTEETSGMMVKAAAPVLDDQGEILGILYGARLLNGDYRLVDKIKEMVYEDEKYHDRDIGTATIFQGDLRIATNVRTADGKRAIGTRISAEVCDYVLIEEKLWVERAFVVNDWYITAYEPIRNLSGKVVGILYVGMLERKFTDVKRNALWTFVGISLGAIAIAILICCFLSKTLMKPISALVLAARRLADGDLKQRVQPDESTEEIRALGEAFNSIAASIEDRDKRLQQRAQEEIMKSEKLAMIGRLAAGVAHEINNPLGSILLFSRLLLRKAPAEGLQRENLERITKEAERCQKIVQGLLEFAHKQEPKTEPLDINEVVQKSVSLLEKQAMFHNVNIVKDFQRDLPPVCADASQLQEVFVNILVNSAEAMNGEGTLTITTRAVPDDDRVEIRFADTGCGIPEEDLHRLFEPFFTTKDVGNGTGLGLSISYGIIQRHGGTVEVASRVNEGSTFLITLPATKEKP